MGHAARTWRLFAHTTLIVACAQIAAAATFAAESGDDYNWQLPPGFPQPFVPADNPMSAAKVTLGCKLFFETRLSSTGTHSCASCHHPELGFTDGRAQAVGATGAVLNRGAMALTNVAYNPAFTWANDRVVTLEAQMEQPLFNRHPVEMGLVRDDPALLSGLKEQRGYATAFESAFPRDAAPVSMGNAIKAIAAFERTLISGRSAFDRYVYDDDRNALSEEAKRGMALFYSERAGCAACHSGINFSGAIVHRGAPKTTALFANNGSFAAGSRDATDRGLIDVTHKERDLGRFRVPTLRNVELTAPYMHDGHVPTLEAVIEHYAAGGQRDGRVNELVDPAIRRLDLSADEKRALIAFLRSLTDQAFVSRDYAGCAGAQQ